MIRAALALLAVAILCGFGSCSTMPIVSGRVLVPVECKEPVDPRPEMPTDALTPEATLDQFVKAATAELEIREGHEIKLRGALVRCTAPLKP